MYIVMTRCDLKKFLKVKFLHKFLRKKGSETVSENVGELS